ncbi:MAG: hypothetical protein QM723_38550 [Myxococcaceae bacterium]
MSVAARTVPLPFRLFHLVALVGFTASAVAAAGTELVQLYAAYHWEYHSGTDPHWLAVGGAALAVLTMLAVVGGIAIKRPLPLLISALVLLGFGLALTGLSFEYSERSVHGANRKFLDLGSALFDVVHDLSRQGGIAPDDPKAWNQALKQIAETQQSGSPYRKGLNEVVPFRLEFTAKEDTWPRNAPPGTVLVWLAEDRSLFSLRFVGLDELHQPMLLKDETGKVVSLRGGAKDDIF